MLIARLPVARSQLLYAPFDVIRHLAVRSCIHSFAVDAHAGGDDQTLHGATNDLLQEHRSAQIVRRGVVLDLVHALSHADGGGEVIHDMHAIERARYRARIAYVAAN